MSDVTGENYIFDVMDPKLPLYQCDKNGTNRKVVANIIEEEKHRSYSIQLPMYFVENELFFEVTETRVLTEPVQKDDGTVQTYDMYWMLAKINLDTGKFELVKEPELTPETGVVQTCGYRNGNIIYVINDYKAKASLYEFDIKTEKAELIWAFGKDEYAIDDESYESGKLFYYNWKGEGNKSRVYAIDIDTKKKELVVEKDIPEGKIYEWRDLLGDSFVYILYDEDAEDFEEELEGELVEYNWKDRTEKAYKR